MTLPPASVIRDTSFNQTVNTSVEYFTDQQTIQDWAQEMTGYLLLFTLCATYWTVLLSFCLFTQVFDCF